MNSRRYEDYWADPSPSPLTDPLTARRRAFLWERIASLSLGPAKPRLLDCGAADGGLVAEAGVRGITATGLEVASAAIERAHQSYPGIDIRRHSVEDLPWPVEPASWDVVVSFEVIEHLLEPRALLEGARAALVPGGALAMSTPYHGLVKNLAIAAFRFDSHFAVDGDHVRFFTDRALCRLLEANGFEVVDVVHLGRFRLLWANSVVWARKV
jgi:2-polyprenyl-6-hydroxyphenyl methylase/3-demethylubiquinone-9 3-methyltransferase